MAGKSLIFAIVLIPAIFIDIILIYDVYVKNIGYEPAQNASFSHRQHIEKYEIKCMFCHFASEKSDYAALPSTKNCLICHSALRNESKLLNVVNISMDSSIPIRWNRIYRLPDFVKFSHAAHIRSQIDCSTCHGEVDKLDSMRLLKPMNMKWCVDCHRNPVKYIIPPRSISGIFQTNAEIKGEELINTVSNEDYFIPVPRSAKPLPLNCSTCHY
ncbi:MAG: cytochrome c3 family protein [Ignavibacteria bacterium]|nr:cytochrome c3 family protein [Ignavibacteria bacterium]